MKYITHIGFFILAMLLIGFAVTKPEPIPVHWEKSEIIKINYPKHFKMTYVVLSTGEVKSASSKHCSKSRNYVVGDIVILNTNSSGCGVFGN